MEEAGCVFLPAAGSRNGTSVGDVGSRGSYWSASTCSSCGMDAALNWFFYDNWMEVGGCPIRCFGYSVRLVRMAQ